ncbi:transcriptional regulator, LacI family [Actinacidiphila alni]|uniref:Transcriptional regulator, LacI family n=1 Tax=Actinacidiphila alni TaxID=380248 RepID=A0A1I1WR25_9ACTN|nr:LacI family DNA-binding transcriptional regulator [Actinacidiphila alni]SFD97627.1 transcriptional regulator, LacI family [Actinacidiphila alni]
MSATMADVAREAGVSASTVSRTFSLPETVRADTRERVLAVARRLDFSPNRTASSLARGRTGALGLLVPDIANPYFGEIVKSVQRRARTADRALFLTETGDAHDEAYGLAKAMARQTDGLLLAGPRMPEDMLRSLAAAGPVALIGLHVPQTDCAYAELPVGMRQAVRHLAALGHRRIVYVNGTRTARTAGFRRLMRAACDEFRVELVEHLGPFDLTYDNGRAAADLVPTSGATAVIAHNDMVAHGVAGGLARQGRSVPGDFSLITVDDTYLARAIHPALTAVHVPIDAMGAHGVDLLLARIADPQGPPRLVALPTALTVRESTGRAPAP